MAGAFSQFSTEIQIPEGRQQDASDTLTKWEQQTRTQDAARYAASESDADLEEAFNEWDLGFDYQVSEDCVILWAEDYFDIDHVVDAICHLQTALNLQEPHIVTWAHSVVAGRTYPEADAFGGGGALIQAGKPPLILDALEVLDAHIPRAESTPLLRTLERIVIRRYEEAEELGQSAWAAKLGKAKWPRSEAESYENALNLYSQVTHVLESDKHSANTKYEAGKQLLDGHWNKVVNLSVSEWDQVLEEMIVGDIQSSPAYLG